MSALAHSQKNKNNTSTAPNLLVNDNKSVTSLNVSARIDYIQRFSKQAVLVVDENITTYSQVARQYLSSLTKSEISDQNQSECNVAFVVASTKLNDIQMRCRIIEQLFSNTLFDPEQSLAVSITRLVKQDHDAITIIVEHAHSLSLQLKYELCQLVDIANKTQNKINVVFFAQEKAVQEIAQNKSIFNKKLIIISAESGQVIQPDSVKFTNSRMHVSRKFWFVLSVMTLSLVTAIALIWFVLASNENFNFSKLPTLVKYQTNVSTVEPQKFIDKSDEITSTIIAVSADVNDIQLALNAKKTLKNTIPTKVEEVAQAVDILEALFLSEQVREVGVKESKGKSEEPATIFNITKKEVTSVILPSTPNYFLNKNDGFVIQIAGFTNMTVFDQFIVKYSALELHSYMRKLNNQPYIVLTSQIYLTKKQAKKAIKNLPEAILIRGPWIKSISTIKEEINTVVP